MSTAVRPGTTKDSWETIFKDYPDEHPIWMLINGELENYALLGRFGGRGMPHEWQQDKWRTDPHCNQCDKPKNDHPIELELYQIVALAHLNINIGEPYKGNPFEAWDYITNLANSQDAETDAKNKADVENILLFVKYGIQLYFRTLLASYKPVVGHFVGRGFDKNKEDADKWLADK